ncbi:MAG: class I SAM-dependent methyltransferase [Gammaproteobacteria bacterium]|nr:class I SAM-dependent methyltransferase [Gammaproteobacteria bacterium]
MSAFAEAADRNKEPIREVLAEWLPEQGRVLEIGSGTGQHAVYFARHFPGLRWLTSDLTENHAVIRSAIEHSALENLDGPLELDVGQAEWSVPDVQAVYTSNTCHIMSWDEVLAMFQKVVELLPAEGRFMVYGPFNLDGEFTSQSNRGFDASLKLRHPHMAIRDLTVLEAVAAGIGLTLLDRRAMPANNMLLCWSRSDTRA